MSATPRISRIHDLLDALYHDQPRLSRDEIFQRSSQLNLSPLLRRLVAVLPDHDYQRDQAGETLARIQREEGMWRDESRTSEADLSRALATNSADGQVDDVIGHEAGRGEEFRPQGLVEPVEQTSEPSEPDPNSIDGRRYRLPPEGPIGPH